MAVTLGQILEEKTWATTAGLPRTHTGLLPGAPPPGLGRGAGTRDRPDRQLEGQERVLCPRHLALGQPTAHVMGAMSDCPSPPLTGIPLYELPYRAGDVRGYDNVLVALQSEAAGRGKETRGEASAGPPSPLFRSCASSFQRYRLIQPSQTLCRAHITEQKTQTPRAI